MDGLRAMQDLNDLAEQLNRHIDGLFQAGKAQAEAERAYKIILRQKALELRADGMPVTLIDKTVFGIPEVADARLKRDIAEAKYKTIIEQINGVKLYLRLLDNQVQREWGRSE